MMKKLSSKIAATRPLRRPSATSVATSDRHGNGGRISAATRRLVWRRDGGKCRRCGSTNELQFDHIVPRSRGGSGEAANVELLCRRCNVAKLANVAVLYD